MSTKKGIDFSGLDCFSALIDENQGSFNTAGKLMKIPLSKIHDDPDNTRREYESSRLKELAESMKAENPATGKPRGVKNPLSLRPHPEKDGEFIINAGHRRHRAATMAELSEVPAFIDENADDYDNTVDNLQREGLSLLEIAYFIKKRLDAGDKKGAIASQLGKSNSFVSDHVIFFDLADCIRDLYDSGRCRSMQALALLYRAFKKHPEKVEAFCTGIESEIATAEVKAFCGALKDLKEPASVSARGVSEEEGTGLDGFIQENGSGIDNNEQLSVNEKTPPLMDAELGNKIQIEVQHDVRTAILMIHRRAAYGLGWIKYLDDGQENEVDLKAVQLVAVTEG